MRREVRVWRECGLCAVPVRQRLNQSSPSHTLCVESLSLLPISPTP